MKFRPVLMFSVCLSILFMSNVAFAQTPTPIPVQVMTTQVIIATIVSLVVGYVTQAIQTGKLFGIETVPQAWIPYLTLCGSFLGAFGLSIQGCAIFNKASFLNALFAGFVALMSAVSGTTIHTHMNAHKVTLASKVVETTKSGS